MDKLIEKYPALELIIHSINLMVFLDTKPQWSFKSIDYLYNAFKSNISCIGLKPAEYETCIKWFCDTMEY